jgi:hypothetical protein
VPKGHNSGGTDAEKRAKKFGSEGRERNIGKESEHSRIPKGSRTQQSNPASGRKR